MDLQSIFINLVPPRSLLLTAFEFADAANSSTSSKQEGVFAIHANRKRGAAAQIRAMATSHPCGSARPLLRLSARVCLPPRNGRPDSFVHHRTFLPWHPHVPPPCRGKSVTHVSGTFCYLCLGSVTSKNQSNLSPGTTRNGKLAPGNWIPRILPETDLASFQQLESEHRPFSDMARCLLGLSPQNTAHLGTSKR
jgi:hypothetical protein